MSSNKQKAQAIKLFLLDVDGVLTNGKLYLGNNSEELKAFNIKDGLGIKLLQRHGIQVGIVTGKTSQLVANRAKDLGIKIVVQGREDKLQAVNELLAKNKFQLNEVAYMGDDLPDLSAIANVGLGMAVNDAVMAIKETADWVSNKPGGDGAVREACDFILEAQNKLSAVMQHYKNAQT